MLSNLCCFNTQFCGSGCLGLTRNKNVKIGYIIIILLTFLSSYLVNMMMKDPSQQTITSYQCQNAINKYECIKHKNTQIMFFGLSFVHFLLLCSMFCKSQKVKIINQGIWIIKILLITLISLVLRLLVGTGFFEYLQYISIWVANVLYIFEIIVFIDLLYSLDKLIDEKALQNGKFYIFKAIISITIMLTSSFVCFMSFKYNPIYVCITNAILYALFIILAILRIFVGNSIFVASSISLCLNIIGFYINDQTQDYQQQNLFLILFKGFFVLFLLFGMLCQGGNKLRTRKSTLNELLALNTTQSQQDNRYVSSNKWTVYHYVMMIIILAIPAVIGLQKQSYAQQSDKENWIQSNVNVWLQTNNIIWWISAIVLYIWSLICCKLFPQKDFSDLQNYFRQYELQ